MVMGGRNGLALAIAGLLMGASGNRMAWGHSAAVELGHDPTGIAFYSGTANPGGTVSSTITTTPTTPGFLNTTSGGVFGGAEGEFGVAPTFQNLVLVGLAIHVTDTAGPSHPLSSLSDPALGDIIADLNSNHNGISAFDFNNPPAMYSGYTTLLMAGESTYGGQPFDILLAAQNVGIDGLWTVSFNGEIGTLDGITAINVTDIGAATPEPATPALLMTLLAPVLVRRRCGE